MKYLISLILCVVLLFGSGEIQAQGQQLIQLKQSIEKAIDSLEAEKLIKINAKLASLSKSDDSQTRKYSYYYRGYSYYRLQSSFPTIGEDQQEKYLEQAINMFKSAIKADSEFAEAYGLLGSCYGMKASGFFSGMKYGPKSEEAMGKAKELAPKNPRIAMLDAVGTLYKPSMFGGGTDKAIEGFQKSATFFEKWTSPNKYAPQWGNAEVFAWLGQAYMKKEEYEKAEEAFQKALEVKPGYPWVKKVLVPKLNKKAD
ncbi:tetratricopeptide repeat protein [Fodinibius halophilus]|uniref:Tetratricopeptide repeat protein n=1 Tax=Fodinibius halophilus TaxID=1736908 RepID=A0A6M1T6C6_9BACT|nr:tetratricopeptide repeat protein [Fodinibius halophilus]NGP89657.1 tetratricopeptide repeat protein [Fodinibius halophilus]